MFFYENCTDKKINRISDSGDKTHDRVSEKREKFTHCICRESSKHDGSETLVEGGHALLSDQLSQDVTETVGILPFGS